jgi:hypothetical protein
MREVTIETKKWKAYDGTIHTTQEICENHERNVAFLNAGTLTVFSLLEFIRDSSFQSGQDIGFIGEILFERQGWVRDQRRELAEKAEEVES